MLKNELDKLMDNPMDKIDSLVKQAKQLGSRGGKARARKYSKEQLSKWAKKGGRPRKYCNCGNERLPEGEFCKDCI